MDETSDPKPSGANTSQWFTVEVARSHERALANAKRLERAWPGRYEIRVAPLGDRFAISVRHRA